MKNPNKQVIRRSIRLKKGYKTLLNNYLKNKGTGGIEFVAENAGVHVQTARSIARTGKGYKSKIQKIEAFVDGFIPQTKNGKTIRSNDRADAA